MKGLATEFRHANLRAVSAKCDIPSDATLGECDALVLVPSQQDRCCKILESGSSASELVLMLNSIQKPKNVSDDSFGAQNDRRLLTFAQSAKRVVNVPASRRADPQTLGRLRSEITDLYRRLRRPLHVGIDLTCFQIYYCLGLVAYLLNNGIIGRMSLFYAEGRYPDKQGGQDGNELFTAGEWSAVAIPGLQNPWKPRRTRMYVVSVGFEGYKTLRLCERREPDRIVVLFPDPGVQPDYVDRCRNLNQPLFDRFSLTQEGIISANAADAVQAWQLMTLRNMEDFENDSVEYMCCGTKPHALGIALRSLCTGKGVVSDIVADEHLPTNVIASGVYWRYDIFDVSAI